MLSRSSVLSVTAALLFVAAAQQSGGAQGVPNQPALVGPQSAFDRGWRNGVPATITGELTAVFADDFERGRSELMHFIRDERTGRTFRVRYQSEPPLLRSGSIVTLTGRAFDSDLFVLAASGDPTTPLSSSSPLPALPPVQGDQKTLVMVTNFTNATVACPVPAVQDTMFSDPTGVSVDGLYREMSLNKVSFSGSVIGQLTIPFASSSPCDPFAWAAAANEQASAIGIDVSQYPRRLYVMPPTNSCPATGYATTSSTPSSAWVFSCELKGVFAHELGHNLGMNHGSTSTMEYGDVTDVMTQGSSRLRPANAPHRHQMGWLADGAARMLSESGTYTVAPLEADPLIAGAPQVLALRKPDAGELYYLSYRTPIGFDSYISGTHFNLLSVHSYAGDGSASRTYLLAALADGEIFSDAANGITVTMMSHDATRATVRVELNSTCSLAAPEIAVPSSVDGGIAGSSKTYQVIVTNRDGAGCPASTLALNASVEQGWSSSIQPQNLTLAPGQAATATVSVSSAASVLPGSYTVSVHAGDGTHDSAASTTYIVSSPCVRNPPSLNASPIAQEGDAGSTLAYGLELTNGDSLSCPASSFDVGAVLPAGWSGGVSQSSISLAPGERLRMTLLVTSPAGAPAATIVIPTDAADRVDSSRAAAISVSYAVQPIGDLIAPSVPTGLAALTQQKTKQIQLSWKAATDNTDVVGYGILRNGVQVGISLRTTWTDTAWVSGASYTYSVFAFDAASNRSAAATPVTVTVPGGSSKRK